MEIISELHIMQNQKGKKQITDKERIKELEEKIQQLALTMDEVEDEKLEVENQLKKALADYHNYLQNAEKRDTVRFFQVKKNLCQELIPSLNAVVMALEARKKIEFDEKGEAWAEGIVATLEKINKTFESIGLQQYMPKKGDSFDNTIHEAIGVVDGDKKGKIVEIVQPGYILEDKVIRPAQVLVSK